jgi:hypothetical protein
MPLGALLLFALLAVFWAGCGAGDGSEGSGASPGAAGGSSNTGGGVGTGGDEQLPSPCGVLESPPAFAIGTGEICYEPLVDGQVVPHITGPQGGYHVWAAVVCPACPREVIVNVGAKLADTEEWVTQPGTRVIELKGGQAAGLIAYLTGDTADPMSHLPEGTRLHLVVELSTLEGAPLHAGEKLVELGEIEVWLNQCDPDPTTCGQPGGKKCCS